MVEGKYVDALGLLMDEELDVGLPGIVEEELELYLVRITTGGAPHAS